MHDAESWIENGDRYLSHRDALIPDDGGYPLLFKLPLVKAYLDEISVSENFYHISLYQK